MYILLASDKQAVFAIRTEMPDKPNEFLNYQPAAKFFEPGRLVMDPAMLKLLPVESLRDITVIAMCAHVAATESYLKAQHSTIEELGKIKF